MKKAIFAALLLFSFFTGFSQRTATTFQKAINSGTSIETLDTVYKSALSSGPDSLLAVFRGKENEFYTEYIALLGSLAKHLKSNGFSWNKRTKCFNRIYFNEDGTIDYFLFNFKPGEIPADKEEQFEKLLNSFIQDYKFPLPTSSKFAQCSPVTYSD